MKGIDYCKIKLIFKKYPELTFNNKGFEYLKPEIREKYKEQIDTLTNILKKYNKYTIRFLNFYIKKNHVLIRYESNWKGDEGGYFVGTNYIHINELKSY